LQPFACIAGVRMRCSAWGLRAATWSWVSLALLLALLLATALATPPLRAWDGQQMRIAAQRMGPGAVAALAPLQNMLVEARGQDDDARLLAVNQFYNLRIDFRPDSEVWGQEDYWATPLQSLAAGRGDCEDYVIAKYTTLLAMGVQRSRLRLVYVRARMSDTPTPVAHMVLAYYATPTAEPLILDNLRADVLPASQRSDLSPVFSFNSEGLWQGVGQATAGDPMARLSRWRDTWQRIQQEGFL
jgi:predicted transglutaminase-like cysteine proteinase